MSKHKRVEELSDETKDLLSASVAIPSLAVLVQELVHNSIDNEASCIAVRVCIDRCARIQVVDNGKGVHNLEELFETPPTNKRRLSRSLYGTKRGSLHSIIKLCERVTITSRRFNTTYTKAFTSYSEPEFITEKRNRPSRGTTVSVDDVFTNMPVRSVSLSYMDLEKAKDMLLKISIANPMVALTLKDTNTGTILLQTQRSPTYADNFMFYCYNKIDAENLRQVKHEVNGYKLDCMLSTQLNSKPRQLVYVNRRCIEDSRIKAFANDILLSALAPLEKKNQENRFPIFIFFITCKPVNVDVCFESNTFLEFNCWDSVFTLLYNSISSFLEEKEIAVPVLVEKVHYQPSPLPPLRFLLKDASPNVNIKSEKAKRRDKSCSDVSKPKEPQSGGNDMFEKITSPDELCETPKRKRSRKLSEGKRLVPEKRIRCSPKKKCKLVCNEDKTPEKILLSPPMSAFTTPPSKINCKMIFQLQNAPVLNHLVDAKNKLDELTKSPTLNPADSFVRPDTYSISRACTDIVNKYPSIKRRSSTPLCPSKCQIPILNLSPIKIFQTKFPSNPVRAKRKRNHVTSASIKQNPSKQIDNDTSVKCNKTSKDFHLETPNHLRGCSKYFCCMPSSPVIKPSKVSDSGYDTSKPTISPDQEKEYKDIDIVEPEISDDEVFEKSYEKQPFEIYHDEIEKIDETPPNEIVTPYSDGVSKKFINDTVSLYYSRSETDKVEQSPKKFSVFHDEFLIKLPVVEEKTAIGKPKTPNNNSSSYAVIEMKDCASSPIKIPVDRGSSPISFSQASSKDANSTAMSSYVVVSKHPSAKNRSVDTQEDLSDIDDSVLADIDDKIDAILQSDTDQHVDSVPDKLEVLSLHESDTAFDCPTQLVTKKLDFSSQACSAIEKVSTNPPPEYRVTPPVHAAVHLVAECSPWNKQHNKLTLPKSTMYDVRKWKSDVFETHGEGFFNAQHNPLLGAKFLTDSCRFDKSVFTDLKVLGQIDSKFIGCVTSDNLVVMVDQHAAHERVRLECMLTNLHKDGNVTEPIISQCLKHPIPVKISRSELDFVDSLTKKLQHVGIIVDIVENSVNIVGFPKVCFTDAGELNLSIDDVVTAFCQFIYQAKESEGSNVNVPRKLVDHFHSRACHGAIKFGDELTLDQCQILIEQLSVCDLPFQCAHGRPSFAPIISLEDDVPTKLPVKPDLDFMKLRERIQKKNVNN